jgi:protein phosphatase
VPLKAARELRAGIVRKPRDDEIDAYGLTHRGKVRAENQDHFLVAALHKRMVVRQTSLPNLASQDTERLAFIVMVADGVGSGAGEEASRFALESISQYLTHCTHCYYTADVADDATLANSLEEAALDVHGQLMERAAHVPGRRHTATTLTLVLGVWPRAYVLQVGDSRYYLMRDGALTQVSRDQTMAQDLIDRGILSHTDAYRSRLTNVLSSAIGGPQAFPVVSAVQNDWGVVHLLCSDGLTKHVSDDLIAQRLREMTSAKQACETLLEDALSAGGTDNITVFVGRCVRKDEE